jgi:hypothetical protein
MKKALSEMINSGNKVRHAWLLGIMSGIGEGNIGGEGK